MPILSYSSGTTQMSIICGNDVLQARAQVLHEALSGQLSAGLTAQEGFTNSISTAGVLPITSICPVPMHSCLPVWQHMGLQDALPQFLHCHKPTAIMSWHHIESTPHNHDTVSMKTAMTRLHQVHCSWRLQNSLSAVSLANTLQLGECSTSYGL